MAWSLAPVEDESARRQRQLTGTRSAGRSLRGPPPVCGRLQSTVMMPPRPHPPLPGSKAVGHKEAGLAQRWQHAHDGAEGANPWVHAHRGPGLGCSALLDRKEKRLQARQAAKE